ncbi:hypothetical protein [Alkalihalobacterium sp. APHAB7]|uniref:hypothetical protein n=1 Tax=Alkalihalobacterium sp. APHAB7 TaxID=3402081 RepID=UPI003AAC2FDF
MKSGRIEQYRSYSQFATLEAFNKSNKMALDIYGQHFTKGERIAFDVLTRFSVKVLGVCNARIYKLVQACQDIKGGISRSTFERMLRKAKSLGIISIIHTVRETGGYAHSVYIFNRFDTPNQEQLTSRKNEKKSQPPKADEHKNAQIGYRSAKFPITISIDLMLPTIVHAFKQTVYHYKQKRIQTSIMPYLYRTMANLLTVEKRKIIAEHSH